MPRVQEGVVQEEGRAKPTFQQKFKIKTKGKLKQPGLLTDSHVITWSFELPEGDIDGDTTLTLGLELVQNPGILERTLAQLSGFL